MSFIGVPSYYTTFRAHRKKEKKKGGLMHNMLPMTLRQQSTIGS